MTWLWIIGITAVVSPVIAALYLEVRIDKRIQTNFTRYGTMHELMDNAVKSEISKLQAVIEQQDALIALLWYKEFGKIAPDSPYDGTADLVSFFGKSPIWYANAMEYPGVFDTLCRHENYPWGGHAEWLRREDLRN